MPTRANSKFEVKSWNEKPYRDEPKLTLASVKKVFHGDLEGESTIEYLMAYTPDGAASFVGIEYVSGTLGGRAGSFVLQHSGTDDGHQTTSHWFVVPGSGAAGLSGLSGQGAGAISRDQPAYDFALDYELA